MLIKGDAVSCDGNGYSVCHTIAQNFVVSCYSDEDTLCGCEIEGLIFESSTVVIYACKAAEGWNASNICLFVEKCFENCNCFVGT